MAPIVAAAGSVHREADRAHEIVIAGQQLTYPALNFGAAVLLGLAALGFLVIAVAARGSWRQFRADRQFVRAIRVLGPLPGHPGVTVIEDPAPQAFCAGYLRPAVYVSVGALALLSEIELEAVLGHERHHRALRDPLRLVGGRILGRALFFLPALRPLGDRYADLAEQRADDAAVEAAGGDRAPLASALLAFDAGARFGSAGISPGRVDSLLGRPAGWRPPSPPIVASLASLSLLGVLIWRASAAASAYATFDLPVLSSRPCLLILASLPLVVAFAALAGLRSRPPGPALASS